MFAPKYLKVEGRLGKLRFAKMAGKNGYPGLPRENDPLLWTIVFNNCKQVHDSLSARCSDVVS